MITNVQVISVEKQKPTVNLKNKVFTSLVVNSYKGKTSHNNDKWLCTCSCGKQITVIGSRLTNGKVKSCGCKSFLDEPVGKKYGLLTVIGKAEGNRTFRMSECVCECGKHTIVANALLRAGLTKSCGCLISWGENQIEEMLKEKNISFQRQYSFDDLRGPKNGLLKFDFAVLKLNGDLKYLIEYQGCQHEKEVWHNPEFGKMQRELTDDMKRKYCKENGIKYYEVWYNEDIKTELNRIFEQEGGV